METPLVTIFCLVYNHGKFLRLCLDGFISQKVNFSVEIVIHDDASTDESLQIIREYMERYPEWNWRPILQKQNQYSQANCVMKLSMPHVQGKYLAWCEGDDYWTDPYKLQKQVDFLEANPDFSICLHKSRMKWEKSEQEDELIPQESRYNGSSIVTLDDYIKEGNYFATNSIVYRWCFDRENFKFEEQFPDDILPGDSMLHMMHLKRGSAMVLPDEMSVYRKHAGGVWFDSNHSEAFYTRNALKMVNFYSAAERVLKRDFRGARLMILKTCLLSCVATGDGEVLTALFRRYPDDCRIIVEPYTLKEWRDPEAQWSKLIRTTPMLRFIKSKMSFYFKRIFRGMS